MYRRVIENLLRLVDATQGFHRNEEIGKTLQQARSVLLTLHKRLSRRRFVFAMVGLSNVGKSTLLNALLGQNLAPKRNGPCTAVPIEFLHGEEMRIVAYGRDSIQRRTWECSSPEEAHRVLSGLADDHEAFASQHYRKIEVAIPLPLLSDGLIIADTPGFGAGQIGEATGSHEAALKEYFAAEVAQILWVIRAEQGITAREMQFHDRWLDGFCDEILVTGCEDWSEQDRRRFQRRFADAFKRRLAPSFHFVSGLEGTRARKAGDFHGLELAGIIALEDRLRTPESRLSAIVARLQGLTEDLGYWMREFRDKRGDPIEEWWHPPTWAWFAAQQEQGSRSPLHAKISSALTPPHAHA